MRHNLCICRKSSIFAPNSMIMETNNKETLDLAAFGCFLKRNWYWFIISLVLCTSAFAAYYLTAQKTSQIEMAVQLRTEEDAVLMPGTGFVQTTSQEIEAGDEKAVIISWDVISKAIRENDLNVVYLEKRSLRWEEKGAWQTDVRATWTKEAFADLIFPFIITVFVQDDAVRIQTKCGRKKAKYTIASLEEPWTSPEGFTVAARKELEPGDQYRAIIYPIGGAVSRYYEDFRTEYPKRSKRILELFATTKYPNNTMAIMRKQLDVYNRVTLDDRKELAKQAVAAIESRITETPNSELKLLLMQRREEKIMAAESTVLPAVIISSPHVTSESVHPGLEILAIFAFVLGIGLPFIVLYLLFVSRPQK